MKRLSWLYILLILVGCTESSIENKPVINAGGEEFYASVEETDSRTYVDNQIRMRWHADDRITIFKKETYNREFKFTGKTGANSGGFKQVSVDDDFIYSYPVNANYAVYPHSSDTQLDETDYFFILNMPAEQTYEENSFGVNANTMVAVSETGNLMFKNVGCYLRVRLYGENTNISSITLTTKGNEAISGNAKVTPSIDGNPTCEMTGTGKSISLNCETPVSISSNSNAPTDFWIVVPPVKLANGFSVTVKNNEGATQVYDVNTSFTFERNKYYDMVREVAIVTDNTPYVTFTAEATQSLSMSQEVKTLEYSVNGGEWKTLGTTIVTFGGELGRLRLRGKNNQGTNGRKISFGNVVPVACSGDIRTLIDYETYKTVYTGYATFKNLFSGCSQLTSAPVLPATTLAESCYFGMFSDCSSLTEAPELPATALAESCYSRMFYDCTSLTSAPELPATTLTECCYQDMFGYCSSLNSAPELPATTLAESCYSRMFSCCPSLTSAPELPATTLTECCYQDMFGFCSSLTEVPELPATVLAKSCYQNMFSGCSSLTEVPELPAMALAESCYSGMFRYCTSLTEAPELPATTLAESCYSGMFYSCSSLTSAPELPATTLAENCYNLMFYICSSLTEVPELPATVLAKSCYQDMFGYCSSLTSAPELPATVLAKSCYQKMFGYCSSLNSAPELPATTLAESCYSDMFFNCLSLTSAPELPATTLAESCYSGMFRYCSKLNKVTMLATNIGASYCLSDWLYKVSSTGTFTKAAVMESLPTGDSGIPLGWTVKDYTTYAGGWNDEEELK